MSSDRSMNRRSMSDTARVDKAISALRQKIKQLQPIASTESAPEPFDISFVVSKEQVKLKKQTRVVRRVRLCGHKYRVGWVVDADMSRCMICAKLFGWFKGRSRHHCRACGSLVCYQCSPYEANIPHIEEGKSRVCKNCFGLKPGLVDDLFDSSETDEAAEALLAPPAPVATFMPFRSPTVVRNHYAFRGDSLLDGSPSDQVGIASQDSTVESTHS